MIERMSKKSTSDRQRHSSGEGSIMATASAPDHTVAEKQTDKSPVVLSRATYSEINGFSEKFSTQLTSYNKQIDELSERTDNRDREQGKSKGVTQHAIHSGAQGTSSQW